MDGYLLKLLSDEDIIKESVNDPLALYFLENKDPDFIVDQIRKYPFLLGYFDDEIVTQELFVEICSKDISAWHSCSKHRILKYSNDELNLKAVLYDGEGILKVIPTLELCMAAFKTIRKGSTIINTFVDKAYSVEVADFIFDHIDEQLSLDSMPQRYMSATRFGKYLSYMEENNIPYLFCLPYLNRNIFTKDNCLRLLKIDPSFIMDFPYEKQVMFAEMVFPKYERAGLLLFDEDDDEDIPFDLLKINPFFYSNLPVKLHTEKAANYICEINQKCYRIIEDKYKTEELSFICCSKYITNLYSCPNLEIDFFIRCLNSYLSNNKDLLDDESFIESLSDFFKYVEKEKLVNVNDQRIIDIINKYGLRKILSIIFDDNSKTYLLNESFLGIPDTLCFDSAETLKRYLNIDEINLSIGSNGSYLSTDSINKDFLPMGVSTRELTLYNDDNLTLRDARFFYISDLHLDYKIQSLIPDGDENKIRKFIHSLATQIANNCHVRWSDWIFIGGDIGSVYKYNELFLEEIVELSDKTDKEKHINVAFVIGNHELWDFAPYQDQTNNSTAKYNEVISKYEALAKRLRIHFLDNELLIIKMYNSYKIPVSFVDRIDEHKMDKYLRDSIALVYGGTGFSGEAKLYNAGNSKIYRGVINFEEDKKLTKEFVDNLFKVKKLIKDRQLIVLSHNPIDNWSENIPFKNCIYINGHNHHNYFIERDDYRIYADAQVGYNGMNVTPKYFSHVYGWDYFADYKDGIYYISPDEYYDFCRGFDYPGRFTHKNCKIVMLKHDGYYMFVSQGIKTGNLSILNGGLRKSLSKKDISYYYNNMVLFGNAVKNDKRIQSIQNKLKEVSSFVKSFGGDGRIHGSIVDINFYNHIYVNIKDGTLSPYYALSIIDKWVYPTLGLLLEDQAPNLLKNYLKLIGDSDLKNELEVWNKKKEIYESDTYIYKDSRIMLKIQAILDNNIIKIWDEDIIEEIKKHLIED